MGLFGNKNKRKDDFPEGMKEETKELLRKLELAKKENDASFIMPRPGLNENECKAVKFVSTANDYMGTTEEFAIFLFDHFYTIPSDRAKKLYHDWVNPKST